MHTVVNGNRRSHLFEKKIHFSVEKESDIPDGTGDSSDDCHYSYISSCAKTPKVPGKRSFQEFASREGKGDKSPTRVTHTIFEMHKFEVVARRVIVTILRQKENEEMKDEATPSDTYNALV